MSASYTRWSQEGDTGGRPHCRVIFEQGPEKGRERVMRMCVFRAGYHHLSCPGLRSFMRHETISVKTKEVGEPG